CSALLVAMPHSLSLPLSPPAASRETEEGGALPRGATAWAAIHLPALPLEALGESATSPQPLAVVESGAPRAPILALNAGARRAGVRGNMAASTACALAQGRILRRRNPAGEAAALDRLAAWGQRFTPAVSLEPPAALLLDVGASIRLFGGIEALQARIRAGLD